MSEETTSLLAKIGELEKTVQSQRSEYEYHVDRLQSEQDQLLKVNEELVRQIDLYKWTYDRTTYPRIKDQTRWKTGRFSFPDASKEIRYYNPAIIRHKNRLLFVTRRWREIPGHEMNDIVFWELNGKKVSNPMVAILPKPYWKEEHGDPRVLVHNDEIYLSCFNWMPGYHSHIALYRLNDNFKAVQEWHPQWGTNGPNMKECWADEKNWTWFVHGKEIHCAYHIDPHTVFRLTDGKCYISNNINHLYRHGPIRGGTNPVRVGKEYFAFFHSRIPWKAGRNRYFMGAYAFEAKPPFKITRMSSLPILSASEQEPMNNKSPLVAFPCGAIKKGRKWLVVYGINDEACGWIEIPHNELLDTMRKLD